MTDATERWLPVPGYESFYEVSDHGRIRSLPRAYRKNVGQILKPWTRGDGHLMVALGVHGNKSYLLHRLIALAFIGPPPSPAHEVCHNDGDPANNVPGNLRWGTRSDNLFDSVRHGTNYWATRTHCAKGHPFDEENTRIVRRNGKTRRVCITCRRDVVRRSDRKRRARAKENA